MGSPLNDLPPNQPADICWRVHPIRKYHQRTFLFFLVLVVTLGAIWVGTHSLFWIVFAALVLILAARQFFLPTSYKLDAEGVEIQFLFYRRYKPWKNLRSYYRDKNGVLLSPFPTRSRLENFRGMYLIFNDNADAVLEFIQDRIDGGK